MVKMLCPRTCSRDITLGSHFHGCSTNHHLPVLNSPISPGFGDEREIAKPRSIECVGGWLTMMDQRLNAIWRFQTRVPFDAWIWGAWWDGRRKFVNKMKLVLIGWKRWRNTRTNGANYATKVMLAYVPVSQEPICYTQITNLTILFGSKPHKVWLCRYDMLWLLSCRHSSLQTLPSLRHYPAKFGQKLVSLFHDLVKNKAGMPALPKELPSSEETFSQMDWVDVWQEAEVVSTCHWLRGGKDIVIPATFRPHLPPKLWSS